MRLFISWSGPTSRAIAEILDTWLPEVIQQVEPWLSAKDIDAGARWNAEIAKELSLSQQGAIIVTPDSFERPWLNFEAGALAKALDESRVRPLLWGMEPEDVSGPLTQFQMLKLADKEDMLKLVRSLNASCERPLDPAQVERAFSRAWDDLRVNLENLHLDPSADGAAPRRSQPEMLTEILETVRALQRSSAAAPPTLRRGHLRDLETDPPSRDEFVFLSGDVVEHPTYGRGVVWDVRDGVPIVTWFQEKFGARMKMNNNAQLLKNLGPEAAPF